MTKKTALHCDICGREQPLGAATWWQGWKRYTISNPQADYSERTHDFCSYCVKSFEDWRAGRNIR